MAAFRMLDVSASALDAERLRIEVHATNLANANTTRTREGGPYRAQAVVFEAAPVSAFERTLEGVRATVVETNDEPRKVFDPGHPDADADGYLALPAVDPILEQADVTAAARAYEANLAVLRVTRDMMARALEITR